MEFSGRLTSVSLADLLQWAEHERRTGCLVFRTSQRQKRIYFTGGQVVDCYSDDPNEFFGQYLLLHGYLGQDQLREALASCRRHGQRLGVVLVEQGVMTLEVVKESLRRRIMDVASDLFLWRHGVFYFENQVPVDEKILPNPINILALAVEGSLWVDEIERIRSVFVHDNILLRQGEAWSEGGQTPLQQRIVERFADLISVSDLYNRVKGTEFRFLEALFELTVANVVDIDSVGEETMTRTTREIRIFDLLIEQAEEEEVVFSTSHLSVPLEVVEGFFPYWIEPDHPEESFHRPDEDTLAFCHEMDGSRSLHDLIMEQGGHREERMELILVELRRGNLALLPKPLDEFRRRAGQPRSPWVRRFLGSG